MLPATSRFSAGGSLAGRRVLIVLPMLSLGGAERQALLIARHLRAEEGAKVEVWGLSTHGVVARLCEEWALPCRLVRTPWASTFRGRLRIAARFALALRRARPDVVMPFTARPNVFCGLTWRLSGARTCVWNQRDAGLAADGGPNWQRFAARLTPAFATNSEAGRAHLVEALGVPPARVTRVVNGVVLPPAALSRAQWRRELDIGDDRLLAVMVANLQANKDHKTLLEAWRQVVASPALEGKRPLLLLAGYHGETAPEVEDLCRSLRLDEYVRLLGPVDDVAGLLAAVDLALLSSRSEGCPNSVLEAMAAGLPVVASDLEGIREAVGDAGRPYLASPGDPNALAERILVLMLDRDLRERLGAANRKRALTDYDPRRSCAAMVALIERALGLAQVGR